ncbi:hypothetical protein [Hydrococcus rivularis]|uniref:hypothetical protein n=1 Tax=Hydrococcus rivularis TaxID=1616834 RepID=UPI001587FF08|nr:hypothetical protein [Hydrococcus rivularis]
MTEIVDRPHPQPLSQFGRGEKNVDCENLKIGIISFLKKNATDDRGKSLTPKIGNFSLF